MPALNYRHLRYFRAIAHAGGLTRAAGRLNISPSALSLQLRKLEEQLGHPLFDRQGKRLALTEAGRIALDYADTVFQAGAELMSTLRGQPTARRQVLRVGALATLSRNFQMDFVRSPAGRVGVELLLVSGTMRELLAQLEAHALDVVLANSPAPRDTRAGLRSLLLDEQPVSVVGKRERKQRRLRFPQDLQDLPILLPSRDSEFRNAFDRLLDAADVRPVIAGEVDDMAMLRLLAREAKCLTLVPPIVVRDELESGLLVERCRVPGVSESFYAIMQKRRFPNPLLAELLPRGGA